MTAQRSIFAPWRTLRIKPREEDDFDALSIINAFGDRHHNIAGVKAYDITLLHEETAKRFAAIGLDIGSNHYELRLMSATTTHMSVFAPVEFPKEALFTKLSEYGDFDRRKTRHLTFKDAGFPHIMTGVRVIQFTKMRKHIPGNMTIQTVSIGFKYTGQPPQCFKCSSLEHMIKDCPLKWAKTPRTDNNENNTENNNENNEDNTATTNEISTETTPATSPDTQTETPKTKEKTPDDQPHGGYKRPPPSTDLEESESDFPAEEKEKKRKYETETRRTSGHYPPLQQIKQKNQNAQIHCQTNIRNRSRNF